MIELLNSINDNSLAYYSAILVLAPKCWEESNRLYQYNKDRDNSIKRYMRELTKEKQVYGGNIKILIDNWIFNYSDMSVKNFLERLVADKIKSSASWIQCIIKNPTILDEAWNKRIFCQDGHTILAQRKTRDSHCFDPVFIYLRNICHENGIAPQNFKLYDSKSEEYEHAFLLEKNSHKYLVEWYGKDGCYSIKVDDNEVLIDYTPDEVVSFMENIIIC